MTHSAESTEQLVLPVDPAVRGMLAEDLPRQLREIREAVRRDALAAAADVAHSVQGSAAFCGIELLRTAARELESGLRQHINNKEAFLAFEREITRVLHALEQSDL